MNSNSNGLTHRRSHSTEFTLRRKQQQHLINPAGKTLAKNFLERLAQKTKAGLPTITPTAR